MALHKKINGRFLRTTIDGYYPHNHDIEIDEHGNGRTVITSSGPVHSHVIRKFAVESDGAHTHQITEETKALLKTLSKGQKMNTQYKVIYNAENETIEIIDNESEIVLSLSKEAALDFAFDIELKVYQSKPKERIYNGIF